jgi:hypothetical protein
MRQLEYKYENDVTTLQSPPTPQALQALMSSLFPLLYFRLQAIGKHVHDLASIAPMISGVVAPLAVLYDIPALSVCPESYVYLPLGIDSPLLLRKNGIHATECHCLISRLVWYSPGYLSPQLSWQMPY